MITFPDTRPDESPSIVWALQNILLEAAVAMMGPSGGKKVYQPTFSERGPRVINTPTGDGAFATLSLSAAGYWPTTVFELAHETVHLLDPVAGCTNYLEEGVAVVFSVEISRTLTNHPMKPNRPQYIEAWQLVNDLHPNIYDTAKQIRERCGALSKATVHDLSALFPDRDLALLTKLVTTCVPR